MSHNIETEVVDPSTDIRFVRLLVDGEEQALVPWPEAEAIAKQVEEYDGD